MLTFEKVLKIFQSYLQQEDYYEVIPTRGGYTVMAWDKYRQDWNSADYCGTPEALCERLLGTYEDYLGFLLTGGESDLTELQQKEIQSKLDDLAEQCRKAGEE